MGLLTATEYDSIRAALDLTLDEEDVPDALIERPIYGAAAELWVMEQDPDWSTRTGTAQVRLLNALIWECAARMAPAMPSILSETRGPYAWSRASVDWSARAKALHSRASAEIAGILTPTQSVVAYPTFFTLAPGRRGK